jgi:predicted lipid-binding transport protein (Tim44 family)
VSPMDVIPHPTATDGTAATATCAGCGAPLAPDQRYCLACGRPCSPARLAFLDVLQAEPQTATMPILGAPQATGYGPPPDPPGLVGSLRRWSGVFGLLGVLLAALLIGLLVGHWLTGGPSTGKQVFEVKGLGSLAAAAPTSGASSSGASTSGTSTGSSSGASSSHHSGGSSSSQSHNANAAKGESESGVHESASEEKEAAQEVKTTKALPPVHKTSSATLQKLEHTTGKQHAKEVQAALGSGPIETH